MVVNMNMRGNAEGNINQYLADTISNVFEEVYTVDVKGSTNRELFASNNTGMLRVFQENRMREENEELAGMIEKVSDGLSAYEAGDYIMTDDKAPVELLSMQVIDELIRDEVGYYRNVYEQEGGKGVLRQL